MSKHTPGPWTTVGGTEVRGGVTVVCDTNGRPDNRMEADARLIAAAPDLLNALENAVSKMLTRGEIRQSELEAIRVCREAIAKAKGTS